MDRRMLALRDTALAFILICGLIAAGRGLHELDFALAIAIRALFISASLVLLVRAFWKRDPSELSRGQIGWLPKRWQRWVLGEDELLDRSNPP